MSARIGEETAVLLEAAMLRRLALVGANDADADWATVQNGERRAKGYALKVRRPWRWFFMHSANPPKNQARFTDSGGSYRATSLQELWSMPRRERRALEREDARTHRLSQRMAAGRHS